MTSSDRDREDGVGVPRGWMQRFQVVRSGALRLAMDWLGRHELPVLAALFLLIFCTWGFVKLAGEVAEGETEAFDRWAVLALRQPNNPAVPLGPRWLHEVGRDCTALGGLAVLTMLTLTVAGFLWLKRMYSAMWLVISATLSGITVSSLLKYAFDRPRPDMVEHLSHVYTTSFPSGHSMLSAVVYLTLGTLLGRFVTEVRLKAYFLLVALTLTFLVGVSRVYMGVHYPTDVLAGWGAGLAWALLCWIVARYLQDRGAVERNVEQARPGAKDAPRGAGPAAS